MRYIIAHRTAADASKSVVMFTYAAEIAETPQQAALQFARKYPDRIVLRVEAAEDKNVAFIRYGMGAWTDEEQAEHSIRAEKLNAKRRDEHEAARKYVSTYTLDEFYAEQEYHARRASEKTPNAEGVHVGDIFYSCWGYDQTNYQFYQVVALRGKHTAVVRENACKSEMCSDYNGYKRPIRDSFMDKATYILRTTYNEYSKCPQTKAPELSGNHHMMPVEYGKLYCHSTGA